VHVFGAAYKRDVNDVRESPSLDIMELLIRDGAVVSFTDPYVPTLSIGGRVLQSVDFDTAVTSSIDCAVIATNHQVFDYARIASMPLVVDTRNALRDFTGPGIVRL
jgi:UDP-N-acetyl-D-glucosamine dehydrogenase